MAKACASIALCFDCCHDSQVSDGADVVNVPLTLANDEAAARLLALGASTYDFSQEPRGSTYDALMRCALAYCSHALLVMQGALRWNENAQSAVRAFRPWLVEEGQSSEWPGTRTALGPARLLIYRFDSGLADKLCAMARRLCQWESPDLPEDLCLFRLSGVPWLGSIAHERDAWLALTEDEVIPVQAAIKPLLLRQSESQ